MIAATMLGLAALGCAPQSVAATAPLSAASDSTESAAPTASSGLQKLTVALAPEMDAARLESGADGKTTLTLPANLLASIRSEADKAGVKASSRVSVSARLTGAGYDITPNGDQSSTLADGQALTFAWQVTPTGPGRAPLSATVRAGFEGAGGPRTFALGVLAATPPAPVPATTAPAGKPTLTQRLSLSHFSLSSLRKLKLPDFNSFSLKQLQVPGHKTLMVPGLGPVASQKVVTATILILVVLALMIIARNASVRRARAERRRRFRTFEATGFGDEPDQDGV